MNVKVRTSDTSFIEKQRRYLLKLRMALLGTAQTDEDEEADIKRESLDRPREYEDDAQKLADLESETGTWSFAISSV